MSGEHDAAGFDYDALLAEIDREVEAKREEGSYSVALDAELEELFNTYAPAAGSDDFDGLLADADRSGAMEPIIPIASQRRGGVLVKQTIARTITWYHAILADQITQFSTAVTGALRVLGARTEMLRSRADALEELYESALRVPEGEDVVPPPTPPGLADVVGSKLAGCDGRILVAEGGDGEILATLVALQLDAYGIEPSHARVGASPDRDLEVHPDRVRVHLESVASGRLAAVVLAGVVERRSPGEAVALLDLALSRLEADGRLIVASRGPVAARLANPVSTDLSSGGPFHPETWQHLLTRRGFECEVTTTGSVLKIDRCPPELQAAMARLDEIVGPEAYVVSAAPNRP